MRLIPGFRHGRASSSATWVRRSGRVALMAGLVTLGVALAPASPGLAADVPAAAQAGAGEPADAVTDTPPAIVTTDPVLRVMPLGDSLTFGKRDPAENGYRATLHDWLTATGVPVDFVGSQKNGTGADTDHEGHPGWRIAQLTENIDQWMADSRPDVVLLDIGTNDLLHHDRIAEAPARLTDLLDHIVTANPQVRIVLAKLLVVDLGHEANFQAYNEALAAVADLYPDNVTLVSMAPVPVANTADHVHPNPLGYQQMAYQWYWGLRDVVPSARMWTPVANPFDS
ncbi:SGNH/GDSL hydrolase family protein [Actinoplanes sp. NPDC026619]|uniref:SGNH/GDSL hydrolase family protein n=1 Tax=Actinoplanes sp. NPDC026619 TaxID=3155798 RepID=UPI0033FF890A